MQNTKELEEALEALGLARPVKPSTQTLDTSGGREG